MKELYEKSLQMIKYGNIKSEKQYRRLLSQFKMLSVDSLEYITGMEFEDIIKLAEEVN